MATIHRDDVVLELPDYVSVADDSPRGRTRRGPPLWAVVDEPARRLPRFLRPAGADGDPTWLAYVVYGRPDGRVVRS